MITSSTHAQTAVSCKWHQPHTQDVEKRAKTNTNGRAGQQIQKSRLEDIRGYEERETLDLEKPRLESLSNLFFIH